MSFVKTDEEEAFSFLTIASTLEWIRKVTGSRTTSGERFSVTASLELARAAFCAGWPLLNAVGGVDVGIGFVWSAINWRIYH